MIAMKVRIRLESSYADSKAAKAVAEALDADNVELKALKAETLADGSKVVSLMEASSIRTAYSTLDDLVRNQQAAEKIVR